MTVLANQNTTQAVWAALRDQKEPPKKNKEVTLEFLSKLFEIFGQRYAAQVGRNLRSLGKQFIDIQASYVEIQKKLKEGVPADSEIHFPETQLVINTYLKETQSTTALFRILKGHSYQFLSFPQRILTYKNPDFPLLRKIEEIRDRAFRLLSERLRNLEAQNQVEKKGKSDEWSEEDEIHVGKVYFSGVALLLDGEKIYFSDLIAMWGKVLPRNRLFEKLNLQNWVHESPPRSRFSPAEGDSFNQFLIRCSIETVEKNLCMTLTPFLKEKLASDFKDESIRSDLCYFTTYMPDFYEMDLDKIDIYPRRPSMHWLRSLQIFQFLIRSCRIRPKNWPTLLEMIVSRTPQWNWKELDCFQARKWEHQVKREDVAEFHESWRLYESLLKLIFNIDVSFENPSADCHKCFADPFCWPLFTFLWKKKERAIFTPLFSLLGFRKWFQIDLSAIYQFFICNQFNWSEGMINCMTQSYEQVMNLLDANHLETNQGQALFIDPPVKLNGSTVTSLGNAGRNTQRFISKIQEYRFPLDRRFLQMLRHFIFHPTSIMFDLLKHAPRLGIPHCGEALLFEVLSTYHKGLEELDGSNLNEICNRAIAITSKIQERFRFTDTQIYHLYFEIIRLVLKGEEEKISRISLVIGELEKFCPALEKKDIHFLFLYHPDNVIPEQFEIYEQLRLDLAKSTHLDRFIIPEDELRKIMQSVNDYVSILSHSCKDELVKDSFEATIRNSLISAFFPPIQPLYDYFRITNLTVNEGIRWGEPVWKTHWGMLKFILKKASVGVYFNWDIFNDKPVLFLSFFDIKKMEAFSGFFPIHVSAQELLPDERRKSFYSLLTALSRRVLTEEADRAPQEGAPENPETWIACFDGLAQELQTFAEDVGAGNLMVEEVDAIWDFLKRVKIAYRDLFLCATANRRPARITSHKHPKVAALGRIFPAGKRGALLPERLLEIEQNRAHYEPDASEAFVESCQRVFSQSNRQPELLNLVLNLPEMKLPISYRVQSADELTGVDLGAVKESKWNEAAPKRQEIQGKYVLLSVVLDGKVLKVPLRYPAEAFEENNQKLFQIYFDYHNLLLKAIAYYNLDLDGPVVSSELSEESLHSGDGEEKKSDT